MNDFKKLDDLSYLDHGCDSEAEGEGDLGHGGRVARTPRGTDTGTAHEHQEKGADEFGRQRPPDGRVIRDVRIADDGLGLVVSGLGHVFFVCNSFSP